MKLSKEVKTALDVVAEYAVEVWKEVADECYDPEDSEGEPYTKEDFIQSDWLDNGYELTDEVSEYIDTAVRKKLKIKDD